MEEDLVVNIDFDKASEEWRKNKKHIGVGMFVYTCKYIHHTGKICGKTVYSDLSNHKYQTGFGGTNPYDPLKNHKYAKKCCKKHLNRYNPYGSLSQ